MEAVNTLPTSAATLPAITKPAAQVQPPEPEPDAMHTESIFHTNTTVGLPAIARSGLQQQAHSGSHVNRFREPTHALNLSYPKNNAPTDVHSMHANLSPTSQPMDLSNFRRHMPMSVTPMVAKDVEMD